MSLITSAATSAAAPAVSIIAHGRKKGGHSGAEGTRTEGQGPTSTQGLFSNLLQSIEQVIGISVTSAASAPAAAPAAINAVNSTAAAASAVTPDAGAIATATATSGTAPQVQGFMHSLLSALKADGLGARSDEASSPGRYGSLTASLQTLLQQVNGNAPTTPATADLKASFATLVQSGTAGAASQTSLQGLLTNLLQKVENSGTQSVRAVGSNVDANV